MKYYAAILLLLLIILQYKFWFEEGGYLHNKRLEKQLAEIKAENEKLKARNIELARKIILVKEDLNEIEALARRNLGMIRQGETFVFIVPENGQASGNATAPPATGGQSSGVIHRE